MYFVRDSGGSGGGAPQKFFQIHSVQSQKNLGDENENKGLGGVSYFGNLGKVRYN